MLRRGGNVPVPGKDLGTARYETLLRRLFSVKGTVAPAIEPKLQAGIDVQDPSPELAFLRGELLAAGVGYQAASVGNYSTIALYPSVPGQLYVIEQIWLWSSGACQVRMRIDARVGVIASNATTVRDTRAVPSPPGLQVYTSTPAAIPISQDYFEVYSSNYSQVVANQQWVLAGGQQSLIICNDAANLGLRVSFSYRERAFEPSEL